MAKRKVQKDKQPLKTTDNLGSGTHIPYWPPRLRKCGYAPGLLLKTIIGPYMIYI